MTRLRHLSMYIICILCNICVTAREYGGGLGSIAPFCIITGFPPTVYKIDTIPGSIYRVKGS